jgi:hypothetical protein
MTALQANLEAFGRYAAARRFVATQGAVATTGSDLALVEREESPTTFIEGKAYTTEDIETLLGAHEAATSVTWTVNISSPDDAPISSPFQTIDERRSEAEKVSELIGLIRRSDELPFARRLARRLEDLVRIAKEEEPDQSEILSESLRMFFGFLREHTVFSEPGVVLTPSGNIRSQWRGAPNELCVVEFLGDGRVNFVVFAPDPQDPDQTIRLSGIALPVEDFMGAVDRYGARRWMES